MYSAMRLSGQPLRLRFVFRSDVPRSRCCTYCRHATRDRFVFINLSTFSRHIPTVSVVLSCTHMPIHAMHTPTSRHMTRNGARSAAKRPTRTVRVATRGTRLAAGRLPSAQPQTHTTLEGIHVTPHARQTSRTRHKELCGPTHDASRTQHTHGAGARLLWNARAWAGAKRARLLEIESNLMCSFRPLVSSPAVRKKPRFTSDGRRSGAKTQPHLGRTDALPSTAARAVVSYRKLEWATRRGMARLLMLDRPAPHAAASRALTWSHRHARAPGRPGRALPRVGHGSAGRARVVEYLARATAYRR